MNKFDPLVDTKAVREQRWVMFPAEWDDEYFSMGIVACDDMATGTRALRTKGYWTFRKRPLFCSSHPMVEPIVAFTHFLFNVPNDPIFLIHYQ